MSPAATTEGTNWENTSRTNKTTCYSSVAIYSFVSNVNPVIEFSHFFYTYYFTLHPILLFSSLIVAVVLECAKHSSEPSLATFFATGPALPKPQTPA